MDHLPPKVAEESGRELKWKMKIERIGDQNVVVLGNARYEEVIAYIDSWCGMHPCEILHLAASEERGAAAEAPNYYTSKVVQFQNKGAWCSAFSVLNAISLFLGFDMAKNIAMNVTLPTVDRMGDLARLANRLSVVQLMHMEGHAGFARGWELDLYSICQLTSGKYIVRLKGLDDVNDVIDHTVCIDADEQLIYDCMETNAMRLEPSAINASVGDRATYKDVLEVRRVVPPSASVTPAKPLSENQKNRQKARQKERMRKQTQRRARHEVKN